MEIKESKERYYKILRLSGRLDTTTYKKFEDYISHVLEQNNKWLLINLADVSFISSSGLRVFLSALKQAKAKKGNIVLCSLSENVAEVFKMSGFKSFFEIFNTEDEAKKYFI